MSDSEYAGFVLYGKEVEEQISLLNDSDKLRFLLAILAYENRGEELIHPEESLLYGLFFCYRQTSERNRARYREISEKRRQAALRRKMGVKEPDDDA